MKSILELTEKRNKLWNAAKEFLESNRNEKGVLSEEDANDILEDAQNEFLKGFVQ